MGLSGSFIRSTVHRNRSGYALAKKLCSCMMLRSSIVGSTDNRRFVGPFFIRSLGRRFVGRLGRVDSDFEQHVFDERDAACGPKQVLDQVAVLFDVFRDCQAAISVRLVQQPNRMVVFSYGILHPFTLEYLVDCDRRHAEPLADLAGRVKPMRGIVWHQLRLKLGDLPIHFLKRLGNLGWHPRAWGGSWSFRSAEITRSRWSLILLAKIHVFRCWQYGGKRFGNRRNRSNRRFWRLLGFRRVKQRRLLLNGGLGEGVKEVRYKIGGNLLGAVEDLLHSAGVNQRKPFRLRIVGDSGRFGSRDLPFMLLGDFKHGVTMGDKTGGLGDRAAFVPYCAAGIADEVDARECVSVSEFAYCVHGVNRL